MTVAVGIASPNVLIVAADSQEDWGLLKRGSQKIRVEPVIRRGTEVLRGRIAIAGAGGSDYLEYLKSKIAHAVQQPSDASADSFVDDVESALEGEMTDFYDNHFAPVAHLDIHRDQEPSLIVAASLGGDRGLWRTHGSTVRRIAFGSDAVGSGAVWARMALDTIAWRVVKEHTATLAACYAIYLAKESDGYCGKETHIVALHETSPLMSPADPDAIRAAEAVFRRYSEMQEVALNYMFTPGVMPAKVETNKHLKAFRRQLSELNFYPVKRQLDAGLQ